MSTLSVFVIAMQSPLLRDHANYSTQLLDLRRLTGEYCLPTEGMGHHIAGQLERSCCRSHNRTSAACEDRAELRYNVLW